MNPFKTTLVLGAALVFCFGVSPQADAAKLTLIKLKCHVSEDREVDEAQLEVRSAEHNWRASRPMRAGDVWNLNRQLIVTRSVLVLLYDLDNGRHAIIDGDDNLGSVRVEARPTHGVRMHTFNRDGAHYTLWYRVDP